MSDMALPDGHWAGPWPGTVVDTKDPLRQGRIRVRAPQVYGDPETEDEFIPDDQIPWAVPVFPTHDLHVPSVGDGVIITFYGGLPWNPIWHGQFIGDGDAPEAFVSAYTPEPKTRIIRTASGHLIEMRWVAGQEKIRIVSAGGSEVNIKDAQAEGGPLIEAFTPGQRKLALDDVQQLAVVQTPTQRVEMLDASQTINIQGPGIVNVTAGGAANVTAGGVATIQGQGLALNSTGAAPTTMVGGGTLTSTFAGNASYTFLGALTYAISLAFTLTVTGALSITGAAGISILVTGGVLALGAAGTKYKLVDERFFAAFNDLVTKYNAHNHGGGAGGPPVAPNVGVQIAPGAPAPYDQNAMQTANTEAN